MVFVARGAIHREEAERYCAIAEQIGAEDDLVTQVLWRSAKAKVLSARGEHDGAMVLARAAVALAEGTDDTNMCADSLMDLALVLSATGDSASVSRRYGALGSCIAARGTSYRPALPSSWKERQAEQNRDGEPRSPSDRRLPNLLRRVPAGSETLEERDAWWATTRS